MCTRLINIKNPLDFEVIVHVSTEGSLILKDSVDATPNSVKKLTSHASHKSSISGGGDDGSVVSNNTLRSSSVTSTGKVLQLSPHVSPFPFPFFFPSFIVKCYCLLFFTARNQVIIGI